VFLENRERRQPSLRKLWCAPVAPHNTEVANTRANVRIAIRQIGRRSSLKFPRSYFSASLSRLSMDELQRQLSLQIVALATTLC
jgi:hypothetical protein